MDQGRSIPLTPLIDVVFLLLIFLLFGDFRHQEGQVSGRVDPPAARSADGGSMLLTLRRDAAAVSVRIAAPGGAEPLASADLDGLDPRRLRQALREAGAADPSRTRAVIATEGDIAFRHVMRLWDRCREMGFADIGLAAGGAEP
jgi:biopolymer transport protein ExbD